MQRVGIVLICLACFACKGKKNEKGGEGGKGFSYESFEAVFKKLSLPYSVTDTGLLKNRDTATIRSGDFSSLVPDSLATTLFGKGSRVRYVALGQLPQSGQTSFYVVKGMSGARRAALLMAFSNGEHRATLPLLVPDNDASTSQSTVVDRSYNINRVTNKRGADNTIAEGRDIYSYDAEDRNFSLVLTNPLNASMEVINPIDTLPRKHRFAGDYVKDKRNYVSVRDGRYPNQLMVYIHLDRNEGACTGELKGELLLTSTTTAVYRQGGDPCVLSFRFGASSVSVKEEEGCGSHRGLDCLFDGSFPRKKESKSKNQPKKK